MFQVNAKAAISKLGLRLRERKLKSSASFESALTSLDEQTISDFRRLVTDTTKFLTQENEQIERGEISQVSGNFHAKQELLKQLEIRQPSVEPLLTLDAMEVRELKDVLRIFAKSLKENSTLLEGMAVASRSILSEVERIKRRQSLEGLYDKKGRKRLDIDTGGKRIEKNF